MDNAEAREQALLSAALHLSDGAGLADGHPTPTDDVEVRRCLEQMKAVAAIASAHRRMAPARRAWGPLTLLDLVGSGRFGEVYRAWDPRLDRIVALKLLHENLSRHAQGALVVEEGRWLARVRHPHVVTVHGADVHDGRVGIVMELVNGRTLAEVMATDGLRGAREATLIGQDVASALAAVHAASLTYRDLKAQNVMREHGGRIVLTDFGASCGISDPPAAAGRMGTPLYMSPEVLAGRAATPADDLYALGALLFHLVTGSFPVPAETLDALHAAHARGERRLLRDVRPDLPAAFVSAVDRAVGPEAGRFRTAGAFEAALGEVLAPDAPQSSTRRSPWTRARTGAVAAVVIAALVSLTVRSRVAPAAAGPRSPEAPAAGDTASLEPPPAAPSRRAAPVAAAPAAFTVDAGLYLLSERGRRRIVSGARVAPGDRLSLEIAGSVPLYAYVLSEDENGEAYCLFPLPGQAETNPLAPKTTHVLPGMREGRTLYWQVTSAGGREHLLVIAHHERLPLLEDALRHLAVPREGHPIAAPVSASVMQGLRGIGGLAPGVTPGTADAGGGVFDLAQRLVHARETVRGPWIRQVDLENPAL